MPQLISILVLAITPPLLLWGLGLSSLVWILLGSLAWIAAVVVKSGPGAVLWWAFDRASLSLRTRSIVWGVWSAACELGLTALVFLYVDEFPSLVEMIGFGVGAAGVEALAIGFAGLVSIATKTTDEGSDPAPGWIQRWSGVVERALASTGHVSSRGLVWVSLHSLSFAPFAIIAVATFAIIDGVAVYGSDAGWDWHDATRALWFYSLVAKVTLIEASVLLFGLYLLR